MPNKIPYFDLNYGDVDQWVATLGATSYAKYDPVTGNEDFTELRVVTDYLTSWKPTREWVPQPICIHQREGRKKYVKADRIVNNFIGPFLSQHAVSKMRPLLEREGHILALDVKNVDEKFYLWWLPWVRNSIDFERSEKSHSGKWVKKIALNYNAIDGLTAFRTHYDGTYNPHGQGQVLVNDEFREKWLQEGLTGIEFELV